MVEPLRFSFRILIALPGSEYPHVIDLFSSGKVRHSTSMAAEQLGNSSPRSEKIA